MKRVLFPDGASVPALGQGTWKMGEPGGDHAAEAAALRLGLDLGLTLIDTAEMYADGGSEQVVAQAIAGRRDDAFLVSKVMPQNTRGQGVTRACNASLRRLNTDRLDLYLLHWPGGADLAHVTEQFLALQQAGKILRWGVSNFDVADLAELPGAEAGAEAGQGAGCAANQVLYNPQARGIEFDLLPLCARQSMPVMAYSPIGQGGDLLRAAALRQVAQRHGCSPAQVALAWCLRQPGLIAIPKSGDADHVRANCAAAGLVLAAEDLAAIDAAFPPPRRKQGLQML